jgi:hypothetical protein
MVLRKKLRANDERFDRVRRELLLAVKVSEDEVSAAAGSTDLYDGVRLRIAAGQREQLGGQMSTKSRWVRGLNLISGPGLSRSLRWTLTAAAILLLAGLATFLWLPKQSRELAQMAPLLPPTVQSPAGGVEPGASSNTREPNPERIAAANPAPDQQRRTSRFHRRPASHTDEVATDFFPLTYTADSNLPESRHVVHVRIPRTALIAFGLPMNVERAGELIKADVVIGDDGLARAIRFIQ